MHVNAITGVKGCILINRFDSIANAIFAGFNVCKLDCNILPYTELYEHGCASRPPYIRSNKNILNFDATS